ncbi:hypothetical protein KAW04_00020, partial [Candidatus Bathyarchaeota archaeon]|nr:hypothetical protein [Candidatus Bathyarchaeota archaeon]
MSKRRKEKGYMLTVKFGKTFRLVMTLACAIFLLQSIALNVSIAHSCLPLVGTLDVEADVGSIHFRGEMAEFYILVSYLGKPVEAEISAILYYNGTMYVDLSAFVEHIATGLYRVPYTIPMEASAGSYALVVGASSPWLKWNKLTISLAGSCALVVGPSHRTLEGTTLESFLLSSTLTSWNAWITDVHGNLTTIKTDIGTIKLSLESLDVKLASIDGRIFAIETNMGTIKADIDDIDLRLTNIEGDMVTMSTALGDINGTIVSIQGDVANIKTDIGFIQTDISAIKVTLQSINGTIVTIQSNIGLIQVSLNQINATLTSLNGTVAT